MHHSVRLLANESKKTNKIHEEWLDDKRVEYLRVKYKVISTCSNLLYKFYEGRKHSKIFSSEY